MHELKNDMIRTGRRGFTAIRFWTRHIKTGKEENVCRTHEESKQLRMGNHYMYYPLDYFLESQAELGFKLLEMWCGLPHFILDDYGIAHGN